MTAARSSWRWFPIGMIASLIVVVMVNAVMIYLAVHSFPGSAGEDGFDLGNAYDHILRGVSQQEALGWRVDADLTADRHVVVHLTDRDGHVLEHAVVQAVATRPVGPRDAHVLTFASTEPAMLRTTDALPPGQWSLAIDVTHDAARLTETKRLVGR